MTVTLKNSWGMEELDAPAVVKLVDGIERAGCLPSLREYQGRYLLGVFDPELRCCIAGHELLHPSAEQTARGLGARNYDDQTKLMEAKNGTDAA